MLRVIGLGQDLAGDDGVGLTLVERASGPLAGRAHCILLRDAFDLVAELAIEGPIVVVDALLDATAPGCVRVVTPDALDGSPLAASSSHGISVGQALALAASLDQSKADPVLVFAVSIPPPQRFTRGLSAPVEAALPAALERLIQLATELERQAVRSLL